MNEALLLRMVLLGDRVPLFRLPDLDPEELPEPFLLRDGLLCWKPGWLHRATRQLAKRQPHALRRFLDQSGPFMQGGADKFRISYYLNEEPPWFGQDASQFGLPVDEELFLTRSPRLQRALVEHLRPSLWSQGAWTPVLEAAAGPEAQAELALARGRPVAAGADLLRQGYRGLQLFLEGKTEEAYADWQKRVRRRKPNIPALPPLVAAFARLAAHRLGDALGMDDPRFAHPALPWVSELFQAWRSGQSVDPAGCGAGLDAAIWLSLDPGAPVTTVYPRFVVGAAPGAELRPSWKSWLESLRRQTQREARPAGPELALYWTLSPEGATPWVGTGEPTRLFDRSTQPDFLTLQDRIALAKRGGEALRALVGHPRLEYEGRPVQLVEVPQKLNLQRSDRGLILRLAPEFQDGKRFRLRRLSRDQVGLTVPSDWNDALRPLLALDHPIPPEGEEELREILGSWAEPLDLDYGPGVPPVVRRLLAPRELVARLRPRPAGLELSWAIRADDLALPALRGAARETIRWNGRDVQVERDLEHEERALERIWDACEALPRETETVIADLEVALAAVEQLRQQGVALEWSEGRPWSLRTAAGTLSVNARRDTSWFQLQGSLRVDEHLTLSLTRALELARAYPGRYLRLEEGDFVRLDARVRQHLQALSELADEDGRVPPLAVPALDEIGLDDLQTDERYAEVLRRFQTPLEAPLPPGLTARLRPYQLEGFRWLAQRADIGAGVCLADDMGLGKTVQTLAAMLRDDGPHLVVCPTSVTGHWREQIGKFAPELEARTRIVSYRALLNGELTEEWGYVVLDEAQAIKNPESRTARAAFQLRARHRLATTGTPIENRLTELWSLFRFLNPGMLGSLASFRRRFEGEHAHRPWLRRLVQPFLLRRLKSDVARELPPRTEMLLEVELSREERALYESVRRHAAERLERGDALQVLAHLTRLRQACCHPRLLLPDGGGTAKGGRPPSGSPLESGTHPGSSAKLVALLDLLEDLRAGGHRALVFSQFTSLLDLVQEDLAAREIDFLRLDGSTPARVRQARVAAFQDGQGDVFLISLKAGGTGLNLTAADYVVHLDPWWNPAAEDQATDRAHRIGQTRPVTVFRLVARETIEEKVLQLHGHKRALARDVLEGEAVTPAGLAELRQLLAR